MNGQAAQVIAFPRQPDHAPLLTYQQLAHELGVSKRFLQERVKEGMPDAGLDYAGRRRFRLPEVKDWLDDRQERLGRGRIGGAQSPPTSREEP